MLRLKSEKDLQLEKNTIIPRRLRNPTHSLYRWVQGACAEAERALTFAELCERWFGAARCSKLEPIKKTALTLQNHLFGLLNYFVDPITNALSEGFNSKIQAIKADTRGFRRLENYRYRILFRCGKLDLRPAIS